MLKYFENNFKYYKNLDVIKQFDFQGLAFQPDVNHFNTKYTNGIIHWKIVAY